MVTNFADKLKNRAQDTYSRLLRQNPEYSSQIDRMSPGTSEFMLHESLFWFGHNGPRYLLVALQCLSLGSIVLITLGFFTLIESLYSPSAALSVPFVARFATTTIALLLVLGSLATFPWEILQFIVIVSSTEQFRDLQHIRKVQQQISTRKSIRVIKLLRSMKAVNLRSQIEAAEKLNRHRESVVKREREKGRRRNALSGRTFSMATLPRKNTAPASLLTLTKRDFPASTVSSKSVKGLKVARAKRASMILKGAVNSSSIFKKAMSKGQRFSRLRIMIPGSSPKASKRVSLKRSMSRSMNKSLRERLIELRASFNKICDTDGKYFHVTKLRAGLRDVGITIPVSEFKTIVETYRERDGQMDFSAFCCIAENFESTLDSEEVVNSMFQALDTDGDGTVTREEFHQKLMEIPNSGLTASDIDAVVNEMDLDNDGEVSLEEFKLMIRSQA